MPWARALLIASVVLLLGWMPVLSACSGPVTAPSSTSSGATPTLSSQPPAASAPGIPPGVAPANVAIPAIELNRPLIDLGILPDGTMAVPTEWDDVGWFTGGGKPGGRGPTVIAAHVDSPAGPAAFIRLREVTVGDDVIVGAVDGSVHHYRVTEVADFPKAEFPTARVFGATPSDQLRLITCGGVFDREAASYTDNRVVFAERVD